MDKITIIVKNNYKPIRKEVPPPDFAHKPKTSYNRQNNKKAVDKELDEWYNDDGYEEDAIWEQD